MARKRDEDHEAGTGTVTHVIERDAAGNPIHHIETNTDGKSFAVRADSEGSPEQVHDVQTYLVENVPKAKK